MSIWDTIATATPPGGGGVYIFRGDYLVTVKKALYKKSQRKKGHELVIVEVTVDEVLMNYEGVRDGNGKFIPGEEASNQEGESASWVRNLTAQPDMAPGDVRAFLAACLDVDMEDLTVAEIKAALDGDGTFLAGVQMHVHAWATPLKDSDGFFTKVVWSNGDRWLDENEEEDED